MASGDMILNEGSCMGLYEDGADVRAIQARARSVKAGLIGIAERYGCGHQVVFDSSGCYALHKSTGMCKTFARRVFEIGIDVAPVCGGLFQRGARLSVRPNAHAVAAGWARRQWSSGCGPRLVSGRRSERRVAHRGSGARGV